MEAGIELDALIAEKIFEQEVGWLIFEYWHPYCIDDGGHWSKNKHPEISTEQEVYTPKLHSSGKLFTSCLADPFQENGFFKNKKQVPHYSTDISAAWQVVERINLFITYELHQDKRSKLWQIGYGSDGAYFDEIVQGETAPHAICLAALHMVK